MEYLQRLGSRVHVIGLQGYLFEGTAVRLVRNLRLILPLAIHYLLITGSYSLLTNPYLLLTTEYGPRSCLLPPYYRCATSSLHLLVVVVSVRSRWRTCSKWW